ncbi:hypothetical protein AYJ54_42995 [Bradyrhizobium centrolobii]|uniref:Methyltransferase n=1 Tax=Bradyrhizobium centrolobii TaxID=1505087 RepID=A0A176Z3E7_9BRAD|nr:hypothetical protein [Bradyrhizobium centrolobii]OAF14066.1 hypothetical protein AYJ54_42995 [Bradyrhizobium centrolobii]
MRRNYLFGMRQAARQAKALQIPEIGAIEFGVAGGRGLLQMEQVAESLQAETGVRFRLYGFDLETGLPPSDDYRDLPYVWRAGFFKMDRAKLEPQLKRATLIIGNVGETVLTFIERYSPPVIGFVSFDLDLYTSTKLALNLFNSAASHFLPRTFCYFDDIVGDLDEIHCEWVGELLAIREFNDAHAARKIAKINGLSWKFGAPTEWHDHSFVFHLFDHPAYKQYINERTDWQLPLPE